MQLPIKHKYVDERLKPLFIFGTSSDGKLVDICFEGEVNPAIQLPLPIAEKVIDVNRRYFEELYKILT